MSLHSLPPLLRDEPGLTRALGDPRRAARDRRGRHARSRSPRSPTCRPTVRSSSPARPGRSPASSTTTCASSWPDEVALFPAWETLPFERVSPARRDDGPAPRGAVAAARPPPSAARRSSSPACGPCCRSSDPARPTSNRSRVRPGDDRRSRRARRPARRVRLPPRGARRAPRRVRPARRDHRRLPVDRRRADPHRPVGRRGRPADRVRRQRPAQRSATSTRC